MSLRHWLVYLGKRRPTSLQDHAQYGEITHDKTTPQSSPMVEGVSGHSLTGRHRKDKGKK